jgi:peptidoglycan/xylan/chitin deacetylase (PgdA/CDA1 family)
MPDSRGHRSYRPLVDRRRFLVLLGAGLAAAAAGRGSDGPGTLAADPTGAPSPAQVTPRPAASVADGLPLPAPTGVVSCLPGQGRLIALTVDDGTNSDVVAAFAQLATDTGLRLTFFPNGRYASWTDNARVLRPLVESGQVSLGNHTWSHLDLTTLSDAEVAAEIRRADEFLRDVFGVRHTAFLRPPFGARNARTDRIAADLGHPTIALWNGTLDDGHLVDAHSLVQAAKRWFRLQTIVVGHANHPTVTTVFDDLLAVLAERRLTSVTLADVWAPAA